MITVLGYNEIIIKVLAKNGVWAYQKVSPRHLTYIYKDKFIDKIYILSTNDNKECEFLRLAKTEKVKWKKLKVEYNLKYSKMYGKCFFKHYSLSESPYIISSYKPNIFQKNKNMLDSMLLSLYVSDLAYRTTVSYKIGKITIIDKSIKECYDDLYDQRTRIIDIKLDGDKINFSLINTDTNTLLHEYNSLTLFPFDRNVYSSYFDSVLMINHLFNYGINIDGLLNDKKIVVPFTLNWFFYMFLANEYEIVSHICGDTYSSRVIKSEVALDQIKNKKFRKIFEDMVVRLYLYGLGYPIIFQFLNIPFVSRRHVNKSKTINNS